jgi:hypothetical protein
MQQARTGISILMAFAVVALAVTSSAKAQINGPVFERVFSVHVNVGTPQAATATAFVMDVDGRQYLITAKHVVNGMGDTGKIEIAEKGDYTMKILRCEDPIDIAVLIPPLPLSYSETMTEASGGPPLWGTDLWFMGFPLGIELPAPKGKGGPVNPPAMIKHAVMSGELEINRRAWKLLLDGYNNPGFSGGPVFERNANNEYKVLAVISGFFPEFEPVTKARPIASRTAASAKAKAEPWRIITVGGSLKELVDTGEWVPLNSGIAIAYTIYSALDLIHEHPIGPALNDPAFR